ncbi:C6 finger domain [Cordyceps militaris]|uniref:C6 finger domain n=1 Tax=Cordyceps militaris TaxID=73501 RepID=A0A2H4SSL1_CORMI|nr:C6 finger domain [Cordyceps militaris]
MQTQRRLKLRSRTGCSRCRSRHQKCDEQRPRCGRCRASSAAPCVYRTDSQLSPPRGASAQLRLNNLVRSISSGYSAFVSLADPSHGAFLDYFIGDASPALCCHETIRHDTCKALVSVGSVVPSLLYSTLLFGALHKAAKGHRGVDSRRALDIQIMELRSAALSLLQTELRGHDRTNSAAVIATTLMLATCELHFDPEASCWRSHFDCARLLLAEARREGHDRTDSTGLWRLIDRMYSLMEFLVSLPAPWPSKYTPLVPDSFPQALPCVESVGVIDGNLACCHDLLDVFKWIKALEEMRQFSQDYETLDYELISAHYVRTRASELVGIVRRMMARDEATPATLSEDLAGRCDKALTEEYRKANSVAHHIALLFLYRYGLQLDRETDRVRTSVASIVRLAESMTKREGLHPSIVLTTALFVAGCEATDKARGDVRALLQIQHEVTRNQSAHRTLQKLEALWRLTSDGSRISPAAIEFDDFIPY